MVEIKSIERNFIECNSIGSIEHNFTDTPNLNNQQFRLNKIREIVKNSGNIFLFLITLINL